MIFAINMYEMKIFYSMSAASDSEPWKIAYLTWSTYIRKSQ